MRLDAGLGLGGDDRPDVHVRVEGAADLHLARGGHDALDQLVVDLRHGGHDRPGQAPLTRGPVTGVEIVLQEHIPLQVFHGHEVVLGPAQKHGALAGAAGRLGDLAGRRRRADHADPAHARVLVPGRGRDVVAVHHVDDPRRQPDLPEDLAHLLHEIGRLGRGLEHERVADADRKGDEPAEHQGREIEGRDPAEDPQRLAHHPTHDVGADLLEGFALDEGRDAAGGLDDLDHALDLPAGFADVLGLVDGDGDGQLLPALFHGTTQVEQEFHPAPDRQAAPGVVGGVSRGDGGRGGRGRAERDLADRAAVGRVEERDRSGTSGRTICRRCSSGCG